MGDLGWQCPRCEAFHEPPECDHDREKACRYCTLPIGPLSTGGPDVCWRCEVYGVPLSWEYDHRADNTGLDDGPPLRTPRKKPHPKSGDEWRDIRARAWATRRQKYGQHGHR